MTTYAGRDLPDADRLRSQIRELEETLEMIRRGGVDAVVSGPPGEEQVYTLTSAERPYRLIVEELNEGTLTVSRHGIVLHANPQLARMLGRDSVDAGTPIQELVDEDDRAAVEALLTLPPGGHDRREVHLAGASGSVPTLLAASCLDLEGTAVITIVATDLTEQKAVEAALRANERRVRQILDAIPVGVYVANVDGTELYANPGAQQVLPEEARLAFPPLLDALAGEATHVEDEESMTAGGRVQALEAWGTPVRTESGDLEFAVVAVTDVTARKAAERELARQAAMLDLAHDAILMWDASGRITFWNHGAEELYGFSRAEATGAVAEQLLATRLPDTREAILAILHERGSWEGEIEQCRADGVPVVVASRWAEHRGADGDLVGVLEVNRDVTARKTDERMLAERAGQLERLNTELERSNDELEQFAYAISHDLSEPLRAISGHVSLVARNYAGKLGPDADESIAFAVDGCDRMDQMIQELLLYSRVGRLEDRKAPVDSGVVVQQVLAMLEQWIEESRAEVTVGDLPTVQADRAQLRQIFLNLISNALKFVPPDVVPQVAIAAEHYDGGWLFSVTDNGIGIEPQFRERIFGMFKRLNARSEYPGTGVGLALVRKTVERHGGRVGVEDAPSGTGSRFWFTIPDQQPD